MPSIDGAKSMVVGMPARARAALSCSGPDTRGSAPPAAAAARAVSRSSKCTGGIAHRVSWASRHPWARAAPPTASRVRAASAALAGAEDDREDDQPQLVDQVVLHQRVHERTAGVDDDLPYQGRTAISAFLRGAEQRRGAPMRLVPTRANAQPAFGCYLTVAETDVARAYALLAVTLEDDRISAITWFAGGGLLPMFGLPRTLR